MVYEPRQYRQHYQEQDLAYFQVMVEETDLAIGLARGQYSSDLAARVRLLVEEERRLLKEYIARHPLFLTTLEPWVLPEDEIAAPGNVPVPPGVRAMCAAARLVGVGPMAAVAGYLAEKVGLFLADFSPEVLVENGGDIWLKTKRPRQISIYAGSSPFSAKIGLKIAAAATPLGICTSSGTVGHSFSRGRADAVVVLADSAVLADAVATKAANLVQGRADLAGAVAAAMAVPGVCGAVAILGEQMVVQGQLQLVPLGSNE